MATKSKRPQSLKSRAASKTKPSSKTHNPRHKQDFDELLDLAVPKVRK